MRILFLLLVFTFASISVFGQAAWSEYPYTNYVQSISTDATNLYVGANGTLVSIDLSSGLKQFTTCVNTPALFDLQTSNSRYIENLAANPNRPELYYASGPSVKKHVGPNWYTTLTQTSGWWNAGTARLANDGSYYFSSVGVWRLMNDTALESMASDTYNGSNGFYKFDLDENDRFWYASTASLATSHLQLKGILGNDTASLQTGILPYNIQPSGIASRSGYVYFHYSYPVASAATHTRLLVLNNTTGDTTTYNIPGNYNNTVSTTYTGIPARENSLAASTSHLFMLNNPTTAGDEATLYRFNAGSGIYTIVDESAFGIAYDIIFEIHAGLNGVVAIAGYNRFGSYASYSMDGVNWTTTSLVDDRVEFSAACNNRHDGPDLMYSANDTALYVLNRINQTVRKHKDGIVYPVEHYDTLFTNAGPWHIKHFAAATNGDLWFSYMDSFTLNTLWIKGVTQSGNYTYSTPFGWPANYYTTPFNAATADGCWFKTSDTLVHASASGLVKWSYANGMLPIQNASVGFTKFGEPFLYKNNSFALFDGGWLTYTAPFQIATVMQRSNDELFVMTDNLEQIWTFDGTGFANTGLTLPDDYVPTAFDRDGNFYSLNMVWSFPEHMQVRRYDSAFTTFSIVPAALNNVVPFYAETLNVIYPAGSHLLIETNERMLSYDPQAPPATLENDFPTNTISGYAFYDYDNNGVKDFWDDYKYVYPLNHNGDQFNAVGNFLIVTDTGLHTLTTGPESYFHLAQDTLTVDFDTTSGNSAQLNFAFIPNAGTHNLKVMVTATQPSPGMVQHIWVAAKNIGADSISGTLTLSMDAGLVANVDTSAAAQVISPQSLEWNLSLSNGEETGAYFATMIPSSYLIGTPLHYVLQGNINETDIDLSNNLDSIVRYVSSSYDPNMKTVDPPGLMPNGLVDTGTVLTYTVFFQNTGNDTAVNVVVRDTLDWDLDIYSFELAGSSHGVDVELKLPNVLEFAFSNIMLPDSGANEGASHGFISYRVKHKPAVSYGASLTNTASIYFDFNDPIVTNTTLNTLGGPDRVESIAANESGWKLYPNPTFERFTIFIEGDVTNGSYAIVNDAVGRELRRMVLSQHNSTVDCSAFLSGIYSVRINVDGRWRDPKKLVVIH